MGKITYFISHWRARAGVSILYHFGLAVVFGRDQTAHGHDPGCWILIYVKSIATYAPTFLGYNNSILGIVYKSALLYLQTQ